MKPLADSLPLLRRHLLPALGQSLTHSLTHSIAHSTSRMGAMRATATKTKASEQNPAESQQAESLPESDLPQSEQHRRQPVPQQHHYSAANRGEDHDRYDRCWSYPNQSLSHVSSPHLFVHSSSILFNRP